MSGQRKKIVFIIYDADTAIGIDNYGRLVFNYNLEDIDTTSGGDKVYAGQDSVLWKNVRAVFENELATMYRNIRSSGKFSYEIVNQMWDNHQNKWPEALKLEDSNYKYIIPYVENGEDRLDMCLGFKKEQRKWWLYNRFKYIDSKYNAGDAASDSVSMRCWYTPTQGETYGISITPYADIYATILYGVAPSRERASRNVASFVPCPLDHMEFTDTYIYSASQIKDFGDLSVYRPDAVEFSKAVNVQSLKFGDSDSQYTNTNLKSLTLGNNTKLKRLDVRNCVNLGTDTQKNINLSGCKNIEEVYFDGTSILGVQLPNGGFLKKYHLPGTITNLTVLNQRALTEFVCPDFSNITTLRLENNSNAIDPLAILDDIQTNSRVRIIGFEKTVSAVSEIEEFYDQLDSMRGLDESGNTVSTAQVSGTIHISSMTGAKYSELMARYPYITLDVESIESTRTFLTWDGSSTVTTIRCLNGVPQSSEPSGPSRASTAQYAYDFAGWSTNMDSQTADYNHSALTKGDVTYYAAYTRTVRTYTITWVNNGTTIETDTNVPYGATPQYNGATPTKDGQTSTGWTPTPTTVTGNATYTATYLPSYSVKFYNGSTLLYTDTVIQGGTASYSGSTPVNSEDSSLAFLGWGASSSSTSADAVLTNIQANKSVYAVFESAVQVVEISDSWDTIIANIDNGTYKTKYKVGNYKPLDLGTEGIINMQIVAIDGDELASGGYAPLSFVGKELLNSVHRMNATNTNENGWPATEMRSYLKNTIEPLIPSNVANRINIVRKSYQDYTTKSTLVSSDKLWIPSYRELFGESSTYEPGNGIMYNSIFKTEASRQKHTINEQGSTNYFTRTSGYDGAWAFRIVTNTGGGMPTSATQTLGVCLGFCLGGGT